jgi:hypothetical protein
VRLLEIVGSLPTFAVEMFANVPMDTKLMSETNRVLEVRIN